MGAGCAELSKVNMSGEVNANKPGDGLMNHWIVPRPPHLHDGDYAAVESPFRHDNSLCNDARSSMRERNGIA